MLGPDEQRPNCAVSSKEMRPNAPSEEAAGGDFGPLKVMVEKVDPSLSPPINYQPGGKRVDSPPMPVIEDVFSLAPLIDFYVSQIPVRKDFFELHYSFCTLMYELVSASSEQELKNWLSQQEIGPVSSSTKVQNVTCLLGVNAREVWIKEEMKSTLSDILLKLNEYTAMKRCPFPHIMRTEGVFIPMLVVKELLFPMVQGSLVDKVLQEHNVDLWPTTNSEERLLIHLLGKACYSEPGWVMTLRELPDIYADVVNVLYYTSVCKHLVELSSDPSDTRMVTTPSGSSAGQKNPEISWKMDTGGSGSC